MKDWNLIIQAQGYDVSPEEMARIKPILDALEKAFRPLTRTIPFDVEPALIFQCERKELK
jgi:hypothetical protein